MISEGFALPSFCMKLPIAWSINFRLFLIILRLRTTRDPTRTALRSGNTGNIFSSTCLATFLQCKLKLSVARITTCVANLSRNKIRCCMLRRRVAKSRLEFYFLQKISVLLLVLPLKLQLISRQIWLQCLWLVVSEARLPGKLKKNMADAADEEDEFEAVDQRISES